MPHATPVFSNPAHIDDLSSIEKGLLFEQYIKGLFNERHFRTRKWRQAGSWNLELYLDNPAYPDLELIFKGSDQYYFAVECKWRRRFGKDGSIEWATKEKIRHYLEFQTRRNIPVFIAIGIGGHPSNPQKLFVTPLQNICNTPIVSESQLTAFKRRPAQRFFYDTVQIKLF